MQQISITHAKKTIFLFQYEVQPLYDNVDFSRMKGAYALCFIVAESLEQGRHQVQTYLTTEKWKILEEFEEPISVSRERYLPDEEGLQYYDEAIEHGSCYVFYNYPHQPH